MTDYDFSRLSPRSFEQLVQSVAARVFGPGIVIFGDGPDGGREATFEHKVPYPSSSDPWDGYGVVQVKHRQRPGDTQKDGSWAVTQLKEELTKYTDPDRDLRIPDYFVYVTNVVLTPYHTKGSKDKVTEVLEKFKLQVGLKGYDIWDYDKMRVFLDTYQDIRMAYTAFITPSDILAQILSHLVPNFSNVYDTLTMYVEKELLSDECVNLEQAGHSVDERIPLANVFVDLPTHHGSTPRSPHTFEHEGQVSHDGSSSSDPVQAFIARIVTIASERLDPASLGASVLSDRLNSGVAQESRGRFVLIGGPGQGKTTLTQFICQIFRAAIIEQKRRYRPSPPTRKALATIRRNCQREGIRDEVVPRFPFKLVLNDFAKALSATSTTPATSILGYLASKINSRTDSDISPRDLRRFLAHYPSVFIFDGLDEVPASSNRHDVLDTIRDFWIEASNINADILSIATSRPQGYNKDFSPLHYQHHQLAELSEDLGWRFAERLAEVRYGGNSERKQKVLRRLRRAFHDNSTSRLMRSPLQVTIMTALVDRIGQPPQALWGLFNSYYNVIYDREVERDIPASKILRDYQPDIKAIHNQVGLLLQIDSERTGGTDARLSRSRFQSLVQSRLEEEGHEGDTLKELASRIVMAASERLVFLVEVEVDQIGFEIRSLQEFMAAESLMEGPAEAIQERLIEIAPIPFWRNVYLFTAGKCFADRQDLRHTIISICAALNERDDDPITYVNRSGSDLAISLLEEGSSRRQPRYHASLTTIALRALDKARPSLHVRLADAYTGKLKRSYYDDLVVRLKGHNGASFLAAWNCLLRLASNRVAWAEQLAIVYWPENTLCQLQILRAATEPMAYSWTARRMLELIPKMPVDELLPILRPGSGRWLKEFEVEENIDAVLSMLAAEWLHEGPQVDVLNTGLYFGPIVRLARNENINIRRLKNIEDWHPHWLVIKWCAEFLDEPSKDTLASYLTSISSVVDTEVRFSTSFGWRLLPWPIVACLNICESSSDILELAARVRLGQLGDISDWTAAESRWFRDGISQQDLLSMSEHRLPFDARIRDVGFPTTLDTLAAIGPVQRPALLLKDVLELFDSVPQGYTRSFVASVINGLVFALAFEGVRDESHRLPSVPPAILARVYRELPSDALVPLHGVIDLISHAITDSAALFDSLRGKRFFVRSMDDNLQRSTGGVLRTAYAGLGQDPSILFVLAELAENGQLNGHWIDVPRPEALSSADEKLAVLIVNLCQSDWKGDAASQLLEAVKELAPLSSGEFHRIVNTLGQCRPVGDRFNKFVVELESIIPDGDHVGEEYYASLLEDLVGGRTSRFTDVNRDQIYLLPKGVLQLLRMDE